MSWINELKEKFIGLPFIKQLIGFLKAAKPQDFEKSESIVLTGSIKGDTFVATEMLMKCPSKYVEDEIQIVEASASN